MEIWTFSCMWLEDNELMKQLIDLWMFSQKQHFATLFLASTFTDDVNPLHLHLDFGPCSYWTHWPPQRWSSTTTGWMQKTADTSAQQSQFDPEAMQSFKLYSDHQSYCFCVGLGLFAWAQLGTGSTASGIWRSCLHSRTYSCTSLRSGAAPP